MDIRSENGQVTLTCQDGAVISVPEADCAMLPLVHSTAERLARYIFTQLCIEFTLGYLHSRQVYAMDVSVGEMPKQEALYRRSIPATLEELEGDPEPVGNPSPCLRCESP
ncbi:unnamed protein product [Chrysoparadoxa australica]